MFPFTKPPHVRCIRGARHYEVSTLTPCHINQHHPAERLAVRAWHCGAAVIARRTSQRVRRSSAPVRASAVTGTSGGSCGPGSCATTPTASCAADWRLRRITGYRAALAARTMRIICRRCAKDATVKKLRRMMADSATGEGGGKSLHPPDVYRVGSSTQTTAKLEG